ncbi:MAG TPA: hypothetical protein VFG54_00215 [Prolixibacteraceae bacterium]|nr:hypothetical protein [Prolixibacteraceae bacterium]
MMHLVIGFFLIIVVAGIIVLTLKASKRLGYKNIGIGIIILIVLILISIPAFFFLKDFFFFKADAKDILKEHEITLVDDFKFEHKSISGIMDYTLQFDLQISKSDKERIIKLLADSRWRNHGNPDDLYDIRLKVPDVLTKDTILYSTYEKEHFWNLQSCKVLSNGYIQTWDLIQIAKNNNYLRFIREE